MLLIVDNQSAYIKKFKREYLTEQDFDYIFIDHNQPAAISKKIKLKGVILSGGRGNPYEPLNLTANYVALINYKVPIIGFCLGHEIIAVGYHGRIKRLPAYNNRKEKVRILKPEDPIFKGITNCEILLQKKHSYQVSEVPHDFEILAESDTCHAEIIKHKSKPIYGFQSHPEVSGKDGIQIVNNFLSFCGIDVA